VYVREPMQRPILEYESSPPSAPPSPRYSYPVNFSVSCSAVTPSAIPTSTSIIGLADNPGTAVEPTCSIATASRPTLSSMSAVISAYAVGQPGLLAAIRTTPCSSPTPSIHPNVTSGTLPLPVSAFRLRIVLGKAHKTGDRGVELAVKRTRPAKAASMTPVTVS
jgi:hypothetical protein